MKTMFHRKQAFEQKTENASPRCWPRDVHPNKIDVTCRRNRPLVAEPTDVYNGIPVYTASRIPGPACVRSPPPFPAALRHTVRATRWPTAIMMLRHAWHVTGDALLVTVTAQQGAYLNLITTSNDPKGASVNDVIAITRTHWPHPKAYIMKLASCGVSLMFTRFPWAAFDYSSLGGVYHRHRYLFSLYSFFFRWAYRFFVL